MSIPSFALPNRKAAGFTFRTRIEDLRRGHEENIVPYGVVAEALEDDKIGFLFEHIFVPEGMDTDKDDDDVRQYMVVLVVDYLGNGETLEKFSVFSIEDYKEDPAVLKALKWFEDYGYPKYTMIERWATFSKWSFRRYVSGFY